MTARRFRSGTTVVRVVVRVVVLVVALGGLFPADAGAVSPTAETLFQEGRRLLISGNTAEACVSLGESLALEASSGTLLNLALCHEKLGLTATAFAEYQDAARLARLQGRDDRAVVAERKRETLRSRLARVTVVAPSDAPRGLTVKSDDGALDGQRLGVPVPLDPGVRQVTVSAPMHHSWSSRFELRVGEDRVLMVPKLEQEPRATVAAAARTRTEPRLPSGAANRPTPWTSPKPSVMEVSLLAGGGALALAGGVLWTMAYAQWKSAKGACNGEAGGCPDFDRRVANIGTLKEIAIGSWAVGASVVAATLAYHHLRGSRDFVGVAFDPVTREFSLRATF
jgi:hypothetical protein